MTYYGKTQEDAFVVKKSFIEKFTIEKVYPYRVIIPIEKIKNQAKFKIEICNKISRI